AVTARVGIRRVLAAGAGEFGVDLDHVAHVHHQQKRRAAFGGRQGADVALPLAAGFFHGRVPGRCTALAVALFLVLGEGFLDARQQIFAAIIVYALFGLADKAALPVEVDIVGRLPAVAIREAHAALE